MPSDERKEKAVAIAERLAAFACALGTEHPRYVTLLNAALMLEEYPITTPPAPEVTEAMVEAHAAEQWAMECRERGFSVNPTWEAMSDIFRSGRRRTSRQLLTAALRGGAK